jgi:hypothetical protein
MSSGTSMTALLGMLAYAGYQNRDKLAEYLTLLPRALRQPEAAYSRKRRVIC